MSEHRRLLRTVAHLRPAQPLHRVRLRAQQAATRRFPDLASRLLTSEGDGDPVGWPVGFAPVDAGLEWPAPSDLGNGRVSLLGHEEELGFPFAWDREVPQLWLYHLHYWDWAWALVSAPDRNAARVTYAALLRSWDVASPIGGPGDAWAPYVVSLRAWSWCGQYAALVAGTDLEPEVGRLLRLHLRFLRRHLELDVGGNHLLKNVKALLGLAVFLGDDRAMALGRRLLLGELARQVLPDGGHFERAPAYHCQVLGDLIDLVGLLGRQAPPELNDAVDRMRRWLGLILMPDGTVPLLNDGFPVPAALVAALEPGPPAPSGLTLLPDAGLAVARCGPTWLLADVGPPCPDELPAHAHADTLGFLLVGGTELLVGERLTSTYAAGPKRDFERGTSAHSTVQIDGADSTEVWGGFRAGRRARPRLEQALESGTSVRLRASHDGYRALPGAPRHRRTWEVGHDGVRISDEVAGRGEHLVEVRLHGTPARLVESETAVWTVVDDEVATGWQRRARRSTLVHQELVSLPWHLDYDIRTTNGGDA